MLSLSSMNHLSERFPALAGKLRRAKLAELPTPVRNVDFVYANRSQSMSVKCDDLSNKLYGGNKVRKLEYLLSPAPHKNIERFATFGTVGSHHALATSLYARELGYPCTCFLAHQRKTAGISATLSMHLQLGTEIVRYGGAYPARMQTIRKHLWDRHTWVVPAGGSSWLGTVGFVNAGLELAAQIATGEIELPNRLYVACGTAGTAAGIALGLALCGLSTEVNAVRVSHTSIANEDALLRLVRKTAQMLRRLDESFPPGLEDRCNIRMRHAFFAGGYAHSDVATDEAIDLASGQVGLTLESTYTGKAMAALLHDLRNDESGHVLFWNTYHSAPLPASVEPPADTGALPEEFLGYID